MRGDNNRTTDRQRNPTAHPQLLLVTRSVTVGAAAKCVLASFAVTAVASSIPQAWSSWTNQNKSASTGETQVNANGEALASSSQHTSQSQRQTRFPLWQHRHSHSHPQRLLRQPQRSLLLPAHANRHRRTRREPLEHGLPPLAQRPVPWTRSSRMASCPSQPSSANGTTKTTHFKPSQLQWQRPQATKSAKPQRQIFKRPCAHLTSPQQQQQATRRPRHLSLCLPRHSATAGQMQMQMTRSRTHARSREDSLRACLYRASALHPARSL